jgi:copper chaperone NosL
MHAIERANGDTSRHQRTRPYRQRYALTRMLVPALALSLGFVAGCAAKERSLVVGDDSCEQCRMAVSDTRYGGQIITTRGRLRTFDSAECLAGYVAATGDSLQRARIFVADYETSAMVPAATAHFLRGGRLRSPMGRALTAFAADRDGGALVKEYGGVLLTWEQLLRDAAAMQGSWPNASSRAAASIPGLGAL